MLKDKRTYQLYDQAFHIRMIPEGSESSWQDFPEATLEAGVVFPRTQITVRKETSTLRDFSNEEIIVPKDRKKISTESELQKFYKYKGLPGRIPLVRYYNPAPPNP